MSELCVRSERVDDTADDRLLRYATTDGITDTEVIHVTEVTQPQGHSTSGSHERYKSKERLEWEVEFDAIRKEIDRNIRKGLDRFLRRP